VPIARPVALGSSSPIWADATVYQYGPDPREEILVLVPPDPSGKLDLIVHAGGFHHGGPADVVPFAQFDMARGTTVVSVGYRLLDDTPWPAPVDDIAEGLDDGFQVAQALLGDRISDVTETGLSAGGTALALINYSPVYPTTTVRPDRIVTVSAPLETDALSPGKVSFGFRWTDALRWADVVPKARVPITLMGTPGDPVAIERHGISNIGQFRDYLKRFHIPVETYFDPHDSGQHGSVSRDLPLYPDVASALQRAQDYGG
jgi:hypothetical protein